MICWLLFFVVRRKKGMFVFVSFNGEHAPKAFEPFRRFFDLIMFERCKQCAGR